MSLAQAAVRRVSLINCNVSGLVRLSGADLALNVITQRSQKTREPFERDLGELSSQDFRQLGLGGSNPPRSNALRQAQRLNRSVQPKDEVCLR
jgi:hypothetical protein